MFEAQLSLLLERIANIEPIDTNVLVDAFLAARTFQLRNNLRFMDIKIVKEQAHVDYLAGKLSEIEPNELVLLKIKYHQSEIREIELEKSQEIVFNFIEHVVEHMPEVHATCEGEFARLNDVLLAKYYVDLRELLGVAADP